MFDSLETTGTKIMLRLRPDKLKLDDSGTIAQAMEMPHGLRGKERLRDFLPLCCLPPDSDLFPLAPGTELPHGHPGDVDDRGAELGARAHQMRVFVQGEEVDMRNNPWSRAVARGGEPKPPVLAVRDKDGALLGYAQPVWQGASYSEWIRHRHESGVVLSINGRCVAGVKQPPNFTAMVAACFASTGASSGPAFSELLRAVHGPGADGKGPLKALDGRVLLTMEQAKLPPPSAAPPRLLPGSRRAARSGGCDPRVPHARRCCARPAAVARAWDPLPARGAAAGPAGARAAARREMGLQQGEPAV